MKPSPSFDVDKLQQTEWKDLSVGFVDPSLWRLSDAICAPDAQCVQEMVSSSLFPQYLTKVHQDDVFIKAKTEIERHGGRVVYSVTLPPVATLQFEGNPGIRIAISK